MNGAAPAAGTGDARFARPRSLRARLRAWLQPQISGGRREQREQTLLLLAVAVVMAPHIPQLPFWAGTTIALFWVWRAWLTRSMRAAPPRVVTASLLVAVMSVIWLEHGTFISRESSVELLLVLTSLKVLEMRAQRDVMVLVFLSLFVLLTRFIDDEGLATALLMAASVYLLFLVLLGVNLTVEDLSFRAKARYVGVVFLQALPMALVLFYFFPRLPAPLWSPTGADASSATGLSNSMSPGTIGHLLQSEAVALRASFDHPPPLRDLYWRGPVLGQFDGRTWSRLAPAQGSGLLQHSNVRIVPGSLLDYAVTLEPSGRAGLLALDVPWEIDGVPTLGARLGDQLELLAPAPVQHRIRYTVRSFTQFRLGPLDALPDADQWTQLPAGYNPRTIDWARGLAAGIDATPARTGAPARALRLADAVLTRFATEEFRYTLDPPLLGRDSVDDFLFHTRAGFCEHYASAFVFAMRAMGVPARVVTGYQGGEPNPLDGFFTVRQSDAHAWAEIWVAGQGWSRVDPTAAIAPWRVDHTPPPPQAQDGTEHGFRATWMHGWRLNREAIENAWNQWFLTYSYEKQMSMLSWLGLSPRLDQVAVAGATMMGLLMTLLAWLALRVPASEDPLRRWIALARSKLVRAGVPCLPSLGPRGMLRSAQDRLPPPALERAALILGALEQARYGRHPPDRRRIRELGRMVRAWKPRA